MSTNLINIKTPPYKIFENYLVDQTIFFKKFKFCFIFLF
jgi:hypothetical protein